MLNAPQTEEPKPRLLQLHGLLTEFTEDADRRYKALQGGDALGAVSGFPTLDRELGGAMAPGLHILHGSPGSGKTAFALQWAATCGCPCLYVTCEMMPIELMRRMAARVTQTYLGRFKSGEMRPSDALGLAKRAVMSAPMLALVDATRDAATPALLSEYATITRQIAPENKHFLLIVDSIHSWVRAFAGQATEYDAINAGLDALRQLAQSLSCPVLGIAERNRASMTGGGQSASAGSRSFEYGSESVLELNTKEEDDAASEREVKLKLSKNRHGTQGKTINLKFKGAVQTFREE